MVQLRRQFQNRKLKKPPKWLYPINAERKYKRALSLLVKEISNQIKEKLIPALPQLLQEATSKNPTTDSVGISRNWDKNDNFYQKTMHKNASCIRKDDFLDVLKGILASIRLSLEPSIRRTISEMERIGYQINLFNQSQFDKVNQSVFGIDIFADEPWLRDQMKIFSQQNSQLITSLPDEDLFQISGIVERGFQEGSRFTEIAKDIQKRFGITQRRANLIARDQTAKLNASLTKLRQESAGIETYRWQTSNDERVRDSHRIMDGRICSWSDPTIWLNERTGKWEKRPKTATQNHTGVDINCRCVSIPRMEDIID